MPRPARWLHDLRDRRQRPPMLQRSFAAAARAAAMAIPTVATHLHDDGVLLAAVHRLAVCGAISRRRERPCLPSRPLGNGLEEKDVGRRHDAACRERRKHDRAALRPRIPTKLCPVANQYVFDRWQGMPLVRRRVALYTRTCMPYRLPRLDAIALRSVGRRRPMAASLTPTSRRAAAVCAPAFGGGPAGP